MDGYLAVAVVAIIATEWGTHGKKLDFTGGELYDLLSVTTQEVNELGNFLTDGV